MCESEKERKAEVESLLKKCLALLIEIFDEIRDKLFSMSACLCKGTHLCPKVCIDICTNVSFIGGLLLCLCMLIPIPVLFLCRSVFEQWRHRTDHPIIQLLAFWCWGQGVSGWGLGQDGALPSPVLDPPVLHTLCPNRGLTAQSGGQVWCGPPASQVQGERHAQTRLGEEVPGIVRSAMLVSTGSQLWDLSFHHVGGSSSS